jgi:hypothetical protein
MKEMRRKTEKKSVWASSKCSLYSSDCPEEGEFSEVRDFQGALYPNEHSCRFESSATQIRSRADAELPELSFRALLTEGVPKLGVALS